MRKAVIDLGTNTFNLLIVECDSSGKLFEIHQEKEGVALGMGGINANIISEDASIRGINTLTQFKKTCSDYGVTKIKAIGTSALRAASNSGDFLTLAEKTTGIKIEIISGNTEANYIYQGVSRTLNIESPYLIMDIGGGSTEFILADKNEVKEAQSFEIGVSRVYQQNEFKDPLSSDDISNINTFLEQTIGEFLDKLDSNILVGASGSFETFYEIINEKDFPKSDKAQKIDLVKFKRCLDEIISSTQSERNLNQRIIPIRKIMAPIAAVKIKYVLDKINATEIIVSGNSLKEGVLNCF